MRAQELLNAWGLRKYGRTGTYTITVDQGGYNYSTYTNDTFPEARVLRDGVLVHAIESPDFSELLNEIIGN